MGEHGLNYAYALSRNDSMYYVCLCGQEFDTTMEFNAHLKEKWEVCERLSTFDPRNVGEEKVDV